MTKEHKLAQYAAQDRKKRLEAARKTAEINRKKVLGK
jgi:hypothetical protein